MSNLAKNFENINIFLEASNARLEADKRQLEEECRLGFSKQQSRFDKLEEELRACEAEVEILFSEKMAKDVPTGKTTHPQFWLRLFNKMIIACTLQYFNVSWFICDGQYCTLILYNRHHPFMATVHACMRQLLVNGCLSRVLPIAAFET